MQIRKKLRWVFLSYPPHSFPQSVFDFHAVSGFSVKGPVEPIMVLLGANATLPCQLSPEQSAADMHIRWYRTQFSPAVFVYQNGQEQGGEQMLEYHGRTELVRDSINRGGVALLIQHVRASDHGQYQCHFKDGQSSQEAIVELHVIGMLTWHRICISRYKAKRKMRMSGFLPWHFLWSSLYSYINLPCRIPIF